MTDDPFVASRNATWAPTISYVYDGAALPLAGGHLALQLRLYPGAAGDALLTINSLPYVDALLSGTAGGADELRQLTVSPQFTPTQLAALPGLNQPEAGAEQIFAFDIRITYADGVSEILEAGTFTLTPGVTTV